MYTNRPSDHPSNWSILPFNLQGQRSADLVRPSTPIPGGLAPDPEEPFVVIPLDFENPFQATTEFQGNPFPQPDAQWSDSPSPTNTLALRGNPFLQAEARRSAALEHNSTHMLGEITDVTVRARVEHHPRTPDPLSSIASLQLDASTNSVGNPLTGTDMLGTPIHLTHPAARRDWSWRGDNWGRNHPGGYGGRQVSQQTRSHTPRVVMIADIGAQFDTAPNSAEDTVMYTPDGLISTNILALMKNAIYGEKVDGSQLIIRHPEDNEAPIHPPIEATLAAKQRAKRAAAALHRMRLNPNTNYADPTMAMLALTLMIACSPPQCETEHTSGPQHIEDTDSDHERVTSEDDSEDENTEMIRDMIDKFFMGIYELATQVQEKGMIMFGAEQMLREFYLYSSRRWGETDSSAWEMQMLAGNIQRLHVGEARA